MEKNSIELRNKKFLTNNFENLQTDPVIKRKSRRSEGFAAHRQLESILTLDPCSKSSNQTLEKFDVAGLNDSRVSTLFQKSSELLNFPNLLRSVLHLLINLTSSYNFACELLFNSEVFREIVSFVESSDIGLVEDALICIGNVILGNEFEVSQIEGGRLVSLISAFMSGDFEKPEETLKAGLWCIWCLVHKRLTLVDDLTVIESLVSGLLDYEELRTDLLKICLSLSTLQPKPEIMKKVTVELCCAEFYQKEHKFYLILILKNVLEFNECRGFAFKAVKKMLLEENELKKAAYGFFSVVESFDPEIVLQALSDCSSLEYGLRKTASFALKYFVDRFQQAQVFQVFEVRTLMILARTLKESDDQIAENLVLVCKVLLEAGIIDRFVEAGCVEALSVIYYRKNKELSKLIEDILKNYLMDL